MGFAAFAKALFSLSCTPVRLSRETRARRIRIANVSRCQRLSTEHPGNDLNHVYHFIMSRLSAFTVAASLLAGASAQVSLEFPSRNSIDV